MSISSNDILDLFKQQDSSCVLLSKAGRIIRVFSPKLSKIFNIEISRCRKEHTLTGHFHAVTDDKYCHFAKIESVKKCEVSPSIVCFTTPVVILGCCMVSNGLIMNYGPDLALLCVEGAAYYILQVGEFMTFSHPSSHGSADFSQWLE